MWPLGDRVNRLFIGGVVLGLAVLLAQPAFSMTPAGDAPAKINPQTGPTQVPASVVPVQTAPPREDGAVVHVVQAGQTLWDIAAVYGVSLDDLLFLNRLARGSVVVPGDEIIVRLGEGQAPRAIHIVREGESLWGIAALHGLTLDELLELNGLRRGAIVNPGDELLIRPLDPTPTVAPTSVPVTIPPTATSSPSPTMPPAASLTPTATEPPQTSSPQPTATVVTRTPLPSLPATLPPAPAAAGAPDKGATAADAILVGAMMVIAGIGLALAGWGVMLVWRNR